MLVPFFNVAFTTPRAKHRAGEHRAPACSLQLAGANRLVQLCLPAWTTACSLQLQLCCCLPAWSLDDRTADTGAGCCLVVGWSLGSLAWSALASRQRQGRTVTGRKEQRRVLVLVCSMDDDAVEWQNGEAIAQTWPHAELALFDGLGHRMIAQDRNVIEHIVREVTGRIN